MNQIEQPKRIECSECGAGYRHALNCSLAHTGAAEQSGKAVAAMPDFSSDAFNRQAEREIMRTGLIGPRDRN